MPAALRSPELTAVNKAASGYDPVTQADRAAEAAMRRRLAELRPEDAVLGEEFGPPRAPPASPGSSIP
jgi:myo-inositol-1(or 4)-monophosphatase